MRTFQINPGAIPFIFAGATSAVLALVAWRRREMPRAPAFATMMAGEMVWAFAEALELIVVPLPVKLLCINLRVLGAVISILGMLGFVLHYTGRTRWLKPRRFAAICALPLVLMPVAWTNPWHHFYWASIRVEEIDGFQMAIRGYGPGFWTDLGYCYILVAVSTFLLAEAVVRSAGVYRAQAAVMLFGVIVPWVVSIIDMSQVFGLFYVDTAAATFAVTGLAFFPGLFRLRLLDVTPVAWAAVVERMNDPVVVIDAGGRIVVLNPAARRFVEQPSREILGVEATRAFGTWPALADRLDRIEEYREASFELEGSDPAVVSLFDARISRLGDDAHPSGWVLVLRDITERRRAEEEKERMFREQVARAEAEAVIRAQDRFLATLSHELRTPLTPILATVTAMLDQPISSAELSDLLGMIRRNVVLEVRLIDDLLDLTRIRGGKLLLRREVVDAHELIHRVIEICRHDFCSGRLQPVLDLAARRSEVDADPIRLQQVFWNLIKNAIKFTPAGGTVTVRSRDGDARPSGAAGSGLVIAVSDTGIGIEPDDLLRIFDLFEQGGVSSARRSGGLGLGLTISRSIVEQHGGCLVAASGGKGLGATFTIEIPLVGAPLIAPVPVKQLTPHALIPHQRLTILLVEDNTDTRNYLSKLLTLRGHTVRTAADLTTALQVAAETEFDLLISDIELPDGTGLQLMRVLRSTRVVPGIALSGFGSSDDIEMSRSAGFSVHLTKPVDFRRLEEVIQQLAARDCVEDLVKS
jgi:PAS domain S-box-containing protein